MDLPEVGGTLSGLRLDSVAGAGGMGVVYRAYDPELDRTVAVKVVRPALGDDDEFRERFRREARLAASIDHPHVVPVLHAGRSEDGFLYLTMRYVDGTDLARLLRDEGRLRPRDAVEMAAQIASALDAAHARGLVHRDVKPANVLVTRTSQGWHCYLTDFGISKDARDQVGLTQTGMTMGTVDYMAPEQLTGGPVDGRADLYALGCVLFQSLTGRVPYPGEHQPGRIYGHVYGPVPDVGTLVPDVPPALAGVVTRALDKDPARRFQSGHELATAARAALSGVALPSTGPGTERTGPDAPTTATPTTPARITSAPSTHDLDTRATPTGAQPDGAGSTAVPASRPSNASSRRLVLGGLAGAVLLGGGGVLAWQLSDRPSDGATGSGSPSSSTGSTGSATTQAGPSTPVARIVGTPTRVGSGSRDIAGVDGRIWSANYDDASITRIEAGSRRSTDFPVGGGPGALLPGGRYVWVWNYSSMLTPVDAETGKAAAGVRLPGTMGNMAVGQKHLWFTVPSQGSVGRLDYWSGTLDPQLVRVGTGPGSIAVLDGTVYVHVRGARALVTLDETSGRRVDRDVRLPASARGVTADGGRLHVLGAAGLALVKGREVADRDFVSLGDIAAVLVDRDGVWTLGADRTTLRRVTPDLRTPMGTELRLPSAVVDMEVVDGSLWLLDGDAATVTQATPA